MTSFCHVYNPISHHKLFGEMPDGSSPIDYMKENKIKEFDLPTVCCIVNKAGNPLFLKRDEWNKPVPLDCSCVFTSYPRGGENSDDFKNLFIALHPIEGAIYNAFNKPDEPKNQKIRQQAPTYRLTGLGNTARLGQPVPVQYGKIRAYPDIASDFYNDMITSKQIIYGRLCLGQGKFLSDPDDLKIGDSPADGYRDVSVGILDIGDSPVLFENDVVTSKEVRNVVMSTLSIGSFFVVPKDFVCDKIEVDLEFLKGLYVDDGSGNLSNRDATISIKITEIDQNGDDTVPGIFHEFGFTTGGSTRQVVRVTHTITEFPFPPAPGPGPQALSGRYRVDLRRNGAQSTDPNISDEMTVVSLKAYNENGIAASTQYTIIEFSVQASEQLNNSNSDIFNIETTRKISTFDAFGSETLDDATKSVVWAYYDMARNSDYGCGLDDTRVDLQHLIDLDQHLQSIIIGTEPPIECNVRFETGITAFQSLSQIAQAARCEVYQRSGKVWLVRNEFKIGITSFFTADNIQKDSVNVVWNPRSEFSPKYFEISYFDETTNQLETVNAVWPGETVSETDIKETLRLYTVTNRTKAWQEGMFYLAQDRLSRKIVSFKTDVEGHIPSMLDKISLTHETLSEEISGTVQDIIGSVVYLSEPVTFNGAMTGQIGFKDKDGTLQGPFTVTTGSNQYNVRLSNWNPDNANIITQADEDVNEATRFTFGLKVQSVVGLVTKTSPGADNSTTVQFAVENGLVHANGWNEALIPALGETHVVSVPYIFSDVSTTTDISTPAAPDVTTKFQGDGYANFELHYTYIVAGVETIDIKNHPLGTPGLQTFNYLPTHGSEVPVKCTVVPKVTSFGVEILLEPLETNSLMFIQE
ncbi:hypothetical protein COB55_04870 [Candidatus Wolfebacteria bacterium]|nr:MAG: hypothetical protein COB55_04870 [Candidatus Wolfebacteria bacterium]